MRDQGNCACGRGFAEVDKDGETLQDDLLKTIRETGTRAVFTARVVLTGSIGLILNA